LIDFDEKNVDEKILMFFYKFLRKKCQIVIVFIKLDDGRRNLCCLHKNVDEFIKKGQIVDIFVKF
jgi:hypothetical protein